VNSPIRVDVYSPAGVKLADGPITSVLGFSYSPGVNKISTFSLDIPAEEERSAIITQGTELYVYVQSEGLVFRGITDKAVTNITPDEKKILHVSGSSIGRKLVWANTLFGLQFENTPLATVIADILTLDESATFSVGALDTPTTNFQSGRFDARSLWQALTTVADTFNYLVREDPVNATISMGAFGANPNNLRLVNVEHMTPELAASNQVFAIAEIEEILDGSDVWNRVIPQGQTQGIQGLKFDLSPLINPPSSPMRFYLQRNTTPAISPAFDAAWTGTASAGRHTMDPVPQDTALSTSSSPVFGAGTSDQLAVQFIYGPIAAQTISGSLTGQIAFHESIGTADAKLDLIVKVVAPGGTVRGTALSAFAIGNEFDATNYLNRTIPSQSLTPVAATEGDYLIVEIGARSTTGAGPSFQFMYGDPASATDLPVDETTNETSPTHRPWIEFNSTIVSLATLQTSQNTDYSVQTATGSDGNPIYYLEDAASIAAFGLRVKPLQLTDILPNGLSGQQQIYAAGSMKGRASTWLARHKDPLTGYTVKVLGLKHIVNGQALFQPGDTFHVVYRGVVKDFTGQRMWKEIDANLFVMAFTRTLTADGRDTIELTLTDVPRDPSDLGSIVADVNDKVETLQVSPIQRWLFGDPTAPYLSIDEVALQMASGAASKLALTFLKNFAATLTELAATYPRVELSGVLDPGTSPATWLLKFFSQDSAHSTTSIGMVDFATTGGSPDGAMVYTGIHSHENGFALPKFPHGTSVLATQIVGGVLTHRGYPHLEVSSETGTTDNLDTVSFPTSVGADFQDGYVLILEAASTHTITITLAGNIVTGTAATYALSGNKRFTMMYSTALSKWVEIART
jgi:hypothetical protein